jgi:hypothetical protein
MKDNNDNRLTMFSTSKHMQHLKLNKDGSEYVESDSELGDISSVNIGTRTVSPNTSLKGIR